MSVPDAAKQRPIRVLHIVSSLGMGGVETWLMELLRNWSNNRHVRADILLTSGSTDIL